MGDNITFELMKPREILDYVEWVEQIPINLQISHSEIIGNVLLNKYECIKGILNDKVKGIIILKTFYEKKVKVGFVIGLYVKGFYKTFDKDMYATFRNNGYETIRCYISIEDDFKLGKLYGMKKLYSVWEKEL